MRHLPDVMNILFMFLQPPSRPLLRGGHQLYGVELMLVHGTPMNPDLAAAPFSGGLERVECDKEARSLVARPILFVDEPHLLRRPIHIQHLVVGHLKDMGVVCPQLLRQSNGLIVDRRGLPSCGSSHGFVLYYIHFITSSG